MQVLHTLNRLLGFFEKGCIVLFLSLMILFTFLDVLFRNLYIHGHFIWANQLMGRLDWSAFLVRLLVLWLSFLGASLVASENKHIKIDLASHFLPRRWLPWQDLVLSSVCMLLAAFLAYTAWGYVAVERIADDRLFSDLPAWIGHLILPLGFGLIFMKFLLRTFELARRLVKGLAS